MTTYTVGIDVAWPQGPAVDWPSVERAGVRFAICKATQGLAGVDPTFARNRDEIRKTSIVFGAYHWFEPAVDPIEQARHFVRTVGPLGELDLLAIDFEDDDRGAVKGKPLLDGVLACLREVERLTGRRPLLYTGRWFYDGSVGFDSAEIATYPLWHAQYPNTKRDARPYAEVVASWGAASIASPWRSRGLREAIWQGDGDGGAYLPQGIDVDVNRFVGDEAAFVAFARSLVVSEPLSPLLAGDAFAVQRALVALGWPLDVDGKIGPKTRAAIAAFQGGGSSDLTDDTLRALDLATRPAPDPITPVEPPPHVTARGVIHSIFPHVAPHAANDDDPPSAA